MPDSDSEDEIIESREPRAWDEVEDTIDDADDDLEVYVSVLGAEQETKVTTHEEIPKGRFVDPLGILRMAPRSARPQHIDDESFDPVAELAGLHAGTSFAELVQGMRRLSRKLSSHEADIKQLVRDNFDRFISCKDVIDGLYDLISENEMTASGTGTGKVEQTTKEVLARANRVYGPLLARKAETDKIRQSLAVLSRFSFLFTLPSKIASNIREGEYDKAVQHYKKAVSIFQDQSAISHISVFMHVFAEVENIVSDFRSTLYSALADPYSSLEAQERVIRILVDLARPSDFRIGGEKETKDDPGWYYLNMAGSRMRSRLSGLPDPTLPPPQSPHEPPSSGGLSLSSSEGFRRPVVSLGQVIGGQGFYRTVRSVCGHVARHMPNLWKMGRYYLDGRFDPRNYGASDKGKQELQAHPQREDKDKVDKSATVRIYFSDETSSVRVDSRKTCGEIIDICLRRIEGEENPNDYAIFTWIEKKKKKDGMKVIKITELGVSEKIHKLHKKWGDKSGDSHKFLFKRKDEKFPITHDPRTVVEDYTLEMRSAMDTKKGKDEGGDKGGRKGESDFLRLITSVLTVFAERVESLFFLENVEDEDFDTDLSENDQSEEWAFGKMRAQVLDVVTALNVLQRAGMTQNYLDSVNKLVLKLCGHYVTRVCGQWQAEVALLYLSVHTKQTVLDSSSGIPIPSEGNTTTSANSITDLPSIFSATTKFYLGQFKGIITKGHPLLPQIQNAFVEVLKCFADTLHHLAFNHVPEDDDDKDKTKMHHQLRVVGYIVHTRNVVIGNLWSHFAEMFKLPPSHSDEEILAPAMEVFRHLGEMTVARYIHDKLVVFNKLVREGILLNPATEWTTTVPPTAVSEYAMSLLLNFVYVYAELQVLDPGMENYSHPRGGVSTRVEKDDLLSGPPSMVINKLLGELLWGTMQMYHRFLQQLELVSAAGACQLELDFSFFEAILAEYASDKSTVASHPVHDLLAKLEEDAYQAASNNGGDVDRLDVDISEIIEDTARRSALLFASLTGSAEATNVRAPKPQSRLSQAPVKKGVLGADMKFGKESRSRVQAEDSRSKFSPKLERSSSKDKELTRSHSKEFEKEGKENGMKRFGDLLRHNSRELFSLGGRKEDKDKDKDKEGKREDGGKSPDVASSRDRDREKIREREREKIKEREREREQKEQREREEKEKEKEKERKKEEARSPNGASVGTSAAMSSREREREKIREREREKLKARR